MTSSEWMATLAAGVDPAVVQLATGISAGMMVASIAVTPAILARLPDDYFLHQRPHLLELLRQGPLSKCLLIVAKNILGTILAILGVIMLFTPGQGLLTILVGLLLLDFPKKQEVLHRIAARPHVARSLNWLRARRGKPPLKL